jgi:gamma-glutamyltranspeptidase
MRQQHAGKALSNAPGRQSLRLESAPVALRVCMVTPFAWSQPHPVNEHVAAAAGALRRRGHDVEVDADWALGRVSAAAKDGPLLKAAANPRFMQGYAFGR